MLEQYTYINDTAATQRGNVVEQHKILPTNLLPAGPSLDHSTQKKVRVKHEVRVRSEVSSMLAHRREKREQ